MASLTQDPRFGSQADQQTDKESNPHGYNSIGTKYVDYGLGANPIRLERDSFARRNSITMHKTTCISAQAISNFIRATVQPVESLIGFIIVIVTPVGIASSRVATINPYL